ncbi:peptidase U35 [Burkholderia lata]|nr:peptidase U35 [Burkholderia lata]
MFSAVVIKSINEDSRIFEGIASTPTADRVNDVVEPLGLTFQKETPLLLNHKIDQPVGTVQFGTPTVKGLPFRAQIPKVDEEGEVKRRTDEAWHSVKSGLIKGVSIRFRPTEYAYKDDGGVHYKKADISELSLTAIPCNPEALITAFKSLSEIPDTAPTTPEGNAQGKQADPPTGAANSKAVETAQRAALKPFFYPTY